MSELRRSIQSLAVAQESRSAPRLGRPSLDEQFSSGSNSVEIGSPTSERRAHTRRSFERTRPPHLSPQSPLSPSSTTFSDIPPSAPDAPGSSLPSSSTSHSMVSNTMDHWAKKVFLADHSATPIPYTGER